MKAHKVLWIGWMVLGTTAAALASDADTSATAGSRWGRRHGTASATAHYEGDVGFARTEARSGRVSTARGVAVGVDRDGLSLSVSRAVAPPGGPAVATNFNLSISRDGRVSGSTGLAFADGPAQRSATAGGFARSGRYRSGAASHASGRTGPAGTVRVRTQAYDAPPRIVRVRRPHSPPHLRPIHHRRPVRRWRP